MRRTSKDKLNDLELTDDERNYWKISEKAFMVTIVKKVTYIFLLVRFF